MEGVYYFGEHLRWNLGFLNPNIAGAFIAILIAFLSPITTIWPKCKSARFIFTLSFVAELILWFLLAQTYSRGAFVAAVICALACGVFFLLCDGSKINILRILALKVALVAIILLSTEFFARISPDYVKDDASISARTALWQGGLKMISQAPLRGWGYGKSGEEYINWYQDLEDEREYAGMVNGHLLLATEYGLPVLFFILILFLFPISLGFFSAKQLYGLPLCGALGLLAFLIVNLFNSLWVFAIFLWIITPIYILASAYACRIQLKRLARLFLQSLVASFSICSLIYLISIYYSDNRIAKLPGYVRLNPGSFSQTIKKVAIFADGSVLGKYYGKTIRRAKNENADILIEVFSDTDKTAHAKYAKYDAIILCGRMVDLIGDITINESDIIVVNPIGLPKDEMARPSLIYLPTLDRFNQNVHWVGYAKKMGLPYVFIEDSAHQISERQLSKILAGFQDSAQKG